MQQTGAVARTNADRRRRQPLEETHPQAELHWIADANYPETPATVTARSRRVFWWSCGSGHEFPAAVYAVARTDGNVSMYECVDCRQAQAAETKRLMTVPLADVPEIVQAWRDEQPLDGLTLGDPGLWKLRCPNGHQPRMSAFRYYTAGCQHCRATKNAPPTETFPALAAQWDPTRNHLGNGGGDVGSSDVRQ